MSAKPRRGEADSGSGLGSVVWRDLRSARLSHDYWEELKGLYYFYLDDESRAKLAGMSRFGRAFALLGWTLKSLLLKLSPARRLLVLVALALAVPGRTTLVLAEHQFLVDLRAWAFVLLLFVMMLELKDKLVAKDEIQIARRVQIALLPREQPAIPGWSVWSTSRPANDVGGDLVDYIEIDGFRHGVVIGDVAGKGLGAALLTAKLQATLRALVPEAASLDDLAARVNAIFHRDGLDNRYATLFYAVIEHDSGAARYLNAGHNPVFVIRGDRTDSLGASSVPLGMLPETRYVEQSLHLAAGEMLLAYSDGLTEAANVHGEEYGAARLETLVKTLGKLSPEEVGRRILDDVDRFLGDARAKDDLSLLVVLRR